MKRNTIWSKKWQSSNRILHKFHCQENIYSHKKKYIMKVQEIYDELVDRGATINNLKSSVRKLPASIRKTAIRKYSLLENRFKKEKALDVMSTMKGKTGYSMGETIKLFVAGHYLMTMDNTEEYARSSKWKAAHGEVIIKLTKREFKSGKVVDGRFCVMVKKVEYDNLWECKFLDVDGRYGNTEPIWRVGYCVESKIKLIFMHELESARIVALQELRE